MALIVLMASHGASAQPKPAAGVDVFAGDWAAIYACDNATGVYADRCRQGTRDGFYLYDLTQDGSALCGYHNATAHMGNRVDDGHMGGQPSIRGVVHGKTANVAIQSGRTGKIGHATLTRSGDTLIWHVTQPIATANENWIPADAVLHPVASPRHRRLAGCPR